MNSLRSFRRSVRLIKDNSSKSGDSDDEVSAEDLSASDSFDSVETAARKPPPLQGYLKKQGDRGLIKGWKRRYFRQRNTKLLYYVSETATTPKGKIDLSTVLDIVIPPSKQLEGGFQLVTSQRIYVLQATSDSDRLYWTTGLKKWLSFFSLYGGKNHRNTLAPISSSPQLSSSPSTSSSSSLANLFLPGAQQTLNLLKNTALKASGGTRVRSMGSFLAPSGLGTKAELGVKDQQIADLTEELAALREQAGLSPAHSSSLSSISITEAEQRLRKNEQQTAELLNERRKVEAELAALTSCVEEALAVSKNYQSQLAGIELSTKTLEDLMNEQNSNPSSIEISSSNTMSAVNEILLMEELRSFSVKCNELQENNTNLDEELRMIEQGMKNQARLTAFLMEPIYKEICEINKRKKEIERFLGHMSLNPQEARQSSRKSKWEKEKEKEFSEAKKCLFIQLIQLRTNLLQISCSCSIDKIFLDVEHLPSHLLNNWVVNHFELFHSP